MQFYSDGILYHVKIHQSKKELPYLLLLHGFMGTGEAFHHLIKPLSRFCNPITVDLAGHGKTETPADDVLFKTGRQVAQLQSILLRLSFDNLFAFGYSMGGRLLFQFITEHPGLLRGAVIESAHCGIQSAAERQKRIHIDQKRAEAILANHNHFVEEWMELPLFRHTPDQQKKEYSDLMKRQNPVLLVSSLKSFGAGVMPYVCEKLQNANLPLYLVAGELDTKYVSLMSEIAGARENCTFAVVENAGHRVHADQPEKLIQIIQSFIKNNHV